MSHGPNADLKPHELCALNYMLGLLKTYGPLTVSQMATIREKETGFKSKTTMQYAIRHGRNQFLLRIAGWNRAYGTRGQMGPMFDIGDSREHPDEPKPVNDRAADNRRYYETKGRSHRGSQKRHFNPWAALAWPDRHIPLHLRQTLCRQDGGNECGYLPPATDDDWSPHSGQAKLQVVAPDGRPPKRRSSP